MALGLGHLGNLACDWGEYERAATYYEESLTLYRELGDKRGIAFALTNLGHTAHALGEAREAAAHYRESLPLCRSIANSMGICMNLVGLARLATLAGHPIRAARLCGAAAALRDSIEAAPAPADRALVERAVAEARAILPDESFAAHWSAGQALPSEAAIAEAYSDL
jgi:tetratricopeptide (TPR) repeat protein